MQVDFYIIDESFAYNSGMSKDDIWEHLYQLEEDLLFIKQKHREDNAVYFNDGAFDIPFYKERSIIDLINYREPTICLFGRDFYNSLLHIVTRTSRTEFSTKDIVALLPQHDENICRGVIAFNEIKTLNLNNQIIVYKKDDWYCFRRYFLVLYHGDGEYFIEECRKYFPNLYFHERNKTTVRVLLSDCSKKTIFYLTELNDKFNEAKDTPYTRKGTLIRFNSLCNFDQDASDEGNSGAKKKSKVKKNETFTFQTKDKKDIPICCDLHLKLLKDDKDKISTDRRIYFSEGIDSVAEGRILIGHMGVHL